MERVFILDYDVVSPLGIGRTAMWEHVERNTSAGAAITNFDPTGFPLQVAAEVRDDLSGLLQQLPEDLHGYCQFDRKLELLAACYALIAPRLKKLVASVPSDRRGLTLGAGQEIPPINIFTDYENDSNLSPPENFNRMIGSAQARGIDVSKLLKIQDVGAVMLARGLGLDAFQFQYMTACSASNQAVAYGSRAVQRGLADLVVVAGSDSMLSEMGFASLLKLGIAVNDGYPESMACRPLDVSRRGTLLGEGAGIVVLANEKVVRQFDAGPVLEILGSCSTLDGYKITAPDPHAEGMQRAIAGALRDAAIGPGDVDYIQLHGTGTVSNDPMELQAIADVFGEHANQLWVSTTKDRHGHLIAAAGIHELIILCESMHREVVPCTLNLRNPIDSHGINLVRDQNRAMPLNVCLNNSFAFGGVNSVVALKKPEELH